MATRTDLILREYEISKDSIKWVMAQLVTVCATFIAVSIVVIELIFDGDSKPIGQTSLLIFVIILLLNGAGAFLCYQNVQVIALQRHIQSLEIQLKDDKTFRWESKIARIWYGDNALTVVFSILIGLPAIFLVGVLYYSFAIISEEYFWIYALFIANVAYVFALGFCIKRFSEKIVKEIPLVSSA